MMRGRPPTRDTVAILARLGVLGAPRGGVGTPGPPLTPTGVTVSPGGGTTPSWFRCIESLPSISFCRLAEGSPGGGWHWRWSWVPFICLATPYSSCHHHTTWTRQPATRLVLHHPATTLRHRNPHLIPPESYVCDASPLCHNCTLLKPSIPEFPNPIQQLVRSFLFTTCGEMYPISGHS